MSDSIEKKEEVEIAQGESESSEVSDRREFFRGLGRWSAIIIGGAALGGFVERPTAAWVNGGGGAWVNARGGGGAGWVNKAGGGGGSWVNRSGGGGWVNRSGGGSWVNTRGGWINRY